MDKLQVTESSAEGCDIPCSVNELSKLDRARLEVSVVLYIWILIQWVQDLRPFERVSQQGCTVLTEKAKQKWLERGKGFSRSVKAKKETRDISQLDQMWDCLSNFFYSRYLFYAFRNWYLDCLCTRIEPLISVSRCIPAQLPYNGRVEYLEV